QPVPFRCPPEGGMIAHEHSNNKLYLCHRPQPEVARCAPGLVFDHKDEVCTSSAAAWPSESVYLSELYKSAANTAREELEKARADFDCPSGFGYFSSAVDEFHYFDVISRGEFHFLEHVSYAETGVCSEMNLRKKCDHTFWNPPEAGAPTVFRPYREEENLTPAGREPGDVRCDCRPRCIHGVSFCVPLRRTVVAVARRSFTLGYARTVYQANMQVLWTLLLVVAVAVQGQTSSSTSPVSATTTTSTTTTTTTTTETPLTTTPDAAELVRQSWAKVESLLKSTVDTQLRRLLPQMLRASGESGMSPECQAANFKVMLGLRQLKSWAIRLRRVAPREAMGSLWGQRNRGREEELEQEAPKGQPAAGSQKLELETRQDGTCPKPGLCNQVADNKGTHSSTRPLIVGALLNLSWVKNREETRKARTPTYHPEHFA
ncbi:hypothetical protein IscW_ISCW003042, partial [Ixodes scapularis]